MVFRLATRVTVLHLGRVLAAAAARGWDDELDVIFTTDHGELQGDFGLLFKGPYHVDGLMRLPLLWRPAPSANVAPALTLWQFE